MNIYLPQAIGISNYTYRTKGHGCLSYYRVKKSQYGYRNGGCVVAKGPVKVLFDFSKGGPREFYGADYPGEIPTN